MELQRESDQIVKQWEQSSYSKSITSTNYQKDVENEYIVKVTTQQNSVQIQLPQAYFAEGYRRFIQLVHYDINAYSYNQTSKLNILQVPTGINVRISGGGTSASYDINGKPTDLLDYAVMERFDQHFLTSTDGFQTVVTYRNRHTEIDKESVRIQMSNTITLTAYSMEKVGTETKLVIGDLTKPLVWDRQSITLRIVDLNT